MKPPFPLLAVLLVAACGDDKGESPIATPVKSKPAAVATPGVEPTASATTKREMPRLPPLTAESARAVMHAALQDLAGDDASRWALLYLADLGDRAGIDAARKLLVVEDGKFGNVTAAAIGAEALLAYGEPDGAAKAFAVAKQYKDDEEQVDEYLVRALGRVQGDERAQAVAELLTLAQSEDDFDEEMAAMATAELAKNPTPAATEAFLRIAVNPTLAGQRRGAAVAGLLHLGDPRGKELAERLVKESTTPAPDEAGAPQPPKHGAASPPNPKAAAAAEAPAPEDLIAGLGVEGATEAAPYVRQAMDALLAEDDTAAAGAPAAKAIVQIFVRGGGAEFRPWLRDWAKRDNFFEAEASLAALSLGDDEAAPSVAKQLEDLVSLWAVPRDWDDAVEILDVVARRGIATTPAFREIVDSAAQVRPAGAKDANTDLTQLNLAAAHAFLKSAKK